MAESRAAIRYAKAVLSLATEKKVADKVAADMKIINTSIAENAELGMMLQSPVVRAADKKAVLTKAFANANGATKSLIDTLIANKRIALLDGVAKKYVQVYDKTSELENVIDSSIIGGFILRVGDMEYNASVANKLNNLKREFSLN